MAVQLVKNSANPPPASAIREMAAWGLFLVILWLIAQFQFGRVLLYYILVLTIILILLTQYQAIGGTLSGAAAFTGGKPS